jgi:hypothetical protein
VRVRIEKIDYYLGSWTDVDAPAVRDRLRLHLGLEPCETPARARELGAASPEALRLLASRNRPRKAGASKYFGVRRLDGGGFDVCFRYDGVEYTVGGYDDERSAAIDADRLARHVGRALLNFPGRRLAPASQNELRKERLRARKRNATSDFLGVVYEPRRERPWFFYLDARMRGGDCAAVGGFSSQREAALARDRAVLHYAPKLRLNFPDEARALGPATIDELRREVHRQRKQSTTSRYRGVYWDKRKKCWIARIMDKGVSYSLGEHDDERVAARAYDAAVLRLGADVRKLNFTGRVPRSIERRRRP